MSRISQIELVSAICEHLEQKGIAELVPRQINAIIEAANQIVDAVAQEPRPAAEGMGIAFWLGCDETGLSSRYMAHVLAVPAGVLVKRSTICNREEAVEQNYPRDPSDFGRCLGLLRAVPELRPHIPLLATGHGPYWAALAVSWNWLEAVYLDELPSGKAPNTYAAMQRLFGEVQRKGGAK